MKIGYASQYGTDSVIIEEGDTADQVVEAALENDATYMTEDRELVVKFPGRPHETYTESAL